MPKKTDSNQREIVEGLREFGATVFDTHMVGHGFPDIVVGYGGKNYLFEIKTDGGRLTPDEVKFIANWRGITYLVRCIEDCFQVLCNGVEDDRT